MERIVNSISEGVINFALLLAGCYVALREWAIRRGLVEAYPDE